MTTATHPFDGVQAITRGGISEESAKAIIRYIDGKQEHALTKKDMDLAEARIHRNVNTKIYIFTVTILGAILYMGISILSKGTLILSNQAEILAKLSVMGG